MLNKFLVIVCFLVSGVAMSFNVVEEIKTCPSSPNCVSSMTVSKKHYMEPWTYQGEKAALMETLKSKVLSLPRAKLVDESSDYYHFIFTSKIFRFKDDVWFFFDEEAKVIHFKSASRTGRSDFGVNGERLATIKKLLF